MYLFNINSNEEVFMKFFKDIWEFLGDITPRHKERYCEISMELNPIYLNTKEIELLRYEFETHMNIFHNPKNNGIFKTVKKSNKRKVR